MAVDDLHELAPAKVNLSLRIRGRRNDGYHLLDSLVAFTDFGDAVRVAPADALSLTVDGPFANTVPTDGGNLVLKAATALSDRLGTPCNAAIHLTKNLPAAGGIGGGSADAAATLRLLCRLWNIAPAPSDLADIALALGADVPVCLSSRPRHMSGIGEKLGVLPPFPNVGILLVNPGHPCSTAAVFKTRQGPFSGPAWPFVPGHSANAFARALARERNDLTKAAISVCPSIREVLNTLRDLPGTLLYRMSGSGSTCFALFATQEGALAARNDIDRPNWWIAAGGLVR